MKIKITEPGWGTYTGLLGAVEFLDGQSVDEVGAADAAHLAAIVAIEEVGTGRNPSDAQRILDRQEASAPVEVRLVALPEQDTAAVAPKVQYTREQLEAIADAQGIKGIREIAEPMGLKGNSIADLIDKVLKAQPAEQAAEEGADKAAE